MDLLVKRALDQAAVWHRPHLRKYPGVEVPYMSHIAGVVAQLARHGFGPEVIAAGALHDVVEDSEVPPAHLEEMFGERVRDLVIAVSEEDRSLPWEERKRRYVLRFATNPWDAQAISLADKIDNFESILVCRAWHGDPWAMFKRGKAAQIHRFRAMAGVAEGLPQHPLIDRFMALLVRLEADGEGEGRGPGSS